MPIRRATSSDQAALCELIAAFRDWMGREAPSSAEIEASAAKLLRSDDAEFLLGMDPAGAPVAFAQLRYRWSVWTTAEDAWIEDLFVLADHRRSGLGKALLDAAVESARTRGCSRVELDVASDNEPARALYRDAGFSESSKASEMSLLLGLALGD